MFSCLPESLPLKLWVWGGGEPGGGGTEEVIFILPHCGGCRSSAQALHRDLSSPDATG